MDGTKLDKVTDGNGNALAPLAGISYEITRVTPVQGQSTFEPIVGVDAFSITVTTDQNRISPCCWFSQRNLSSGGKKTIICCSQ